MHSIEISSRPMKSSSKFLLPDGTNEMSVTKRNTFYLDRKALKNYHNNIDQMKTNLMKSYNI